jgi:hypothetical protein
MALQLTNTGNQALPLFHQGHFFVLAPAETRLLPGGQLSHSQRIAQLTGNLVVVHLSDELARQQLAPPEPTAVRVESPPKVKPPKSSPVVETAQVTPQPGS